jgi:TMEM175 potassium channel family protein
VGSLVAMSTETGRVERQDDDVPGIDRLLALSDGVVAIALTLLVLQLRVPSLPAGSADSASALASALAKGGDQLTAYVISFYVVAQFWLVHHRVFQHLAGQRESLAWWNFAFLFTITIMPFTSDMLGQYGNNPLAVDIFALNLLLAALATQATSELGRRRGLMTPGSHSAARRGGLLRSVGTILVLAASMGLAWWNAGNAKFVWLLLALVPNLVDWWMRHHPRPEDEPAPAAGPPGADPR